jgi:two-component system OmpR family response regulator
MALSQGAADTASIDGRKDAAVETAGCHVLLVDDDISLSHALGDYLRKNYFRVTAVANGKQMLELMAEEPIDVLLMEAELPGEDGLALTRTVRQSSVVPMVVLSERAEEADRVMGLELGADDYVTKPFSQRELLARIRALLRRCRLDAESNLQVASAAGLRAYRFSGWELNVRLSRLTSPCGKRVALSRGQFSLLRAFLSAPQRVLTRDQLLDLTRLHSADVYDRAIDTQILRLRRKVEADASRPELIKTERGVGYYFDAAVDVIR